MIKWIRNLFSCNWPSPETINAEGPASFHLERRVNAVVLKISTSVVSDDLPDRVININLSLSDPEALRGLSALLLNAAQRLEPPYYSEEDVGQLWENENPDIYADALETLGEEWLHAPNVHFGLKTPEEIIKSGKGYWVRESLHSIKTGEFS